MRAVLNTTIQIRAWRFGVKLYTLTRPDEDSMLHWMHRTCLSQLKQFLTCPTCQVIPPPEDQVRAAVLPGETVLIEDNELQAITPGALAVDRQLTVESFVPLRQIMPWWVFQAYTLAPADDPSSRGYQLLAEMLETEGATAVTRITPRSRTRVALIASVQRQLQLWSLHYAEHMNPVPPFTHRLGPNEKERRLARRLVRHMAQPFVHANYRDASAARLQELIERKKAGQPTKVPLMQIADVPAHATLVAALEASNATRKKAPRGKAGRK